MAKGIRAKHKELVEGLHERVKRNFLEHGSLTPVTFMITYNNKVNIIGGAFTSSAQKEAYAGAVRQLSIKEKAVGTIFASEAWSIKSKGKSEEDKDAILEEYEKVGSLENMPGRIEAIVIVEEYLDATYITTYEIIRKGKKLSLKNAKPMKMDSDSPAEGRMTNMIGKPNFNM